MGTDPGYGYCEQVAAAELLAILEFGGRGRIQSPHSCLRSPGYEC